MSYMDEQLRFAFHWGYLKSKKIKLNTRPLRNVVLNRDALERSGVYSRSARRHEKLNGLPGAWQRCQGVCTKDVTQFAGKLVISVIDTARTDTGK